MRTTTRLALAAALALTATIATAQPGPPSNTTDCSAITPADIEGSVTIPLSGTDTTDFDVTYAGTTFSNVPAGDFSLPNIRGDITDLLIRANGFDMGNPASDEIGCDLNYNPPSSVCNQTPDSGPVEVGTVITLELDATNTISALVSGVSMTPNFDPATNFSTIWSATHTAVQDTVLTGTALNPDGEQSTCNWPIDVLAVDLSMELEATSLGGGAHTVTATVTHNEGDDADDVAIDLEIPNGVNLIEVDPGSDGVCDMTLPLAGPGLFTCSYTTPTSVGAQRAMTALVQITGTGQFDIMASVRSSLTDPNPVNDSASVLIQSATTAIPTLGEGALALLAALMGGVGALFLRTRT